MQFLNHREQHLLKDKSALQSQKTLTSMTFFLIFWIKKVCFIIYPVSPVFSFGENSELCLP